MLIILYMVASMCRAVVRSLSLLRVSLCYRTAHPLAVYRSARFI